LIACSTAPNSIPPPRFTWPVPWALETLLLSICLEHGKMIGDIVSKLGRKEGNFPLSQKAAGE